MTSREGHIGLFDSGIGGIFIVRAIQKHPKLKRYKISYFGDVAHMPYGSKSSEEVYALTVRGVEKLFREGAHIVVLACNTASAQALRRIQQEWLPAHYPHRRVLGVVIPTIEAAMDAHDKKDLLVLATPSTVASHVYKREIEKVHPKAKVREVAVPYAAQLIESGAIPYATALLAHAIRSRKRHGAVLLGCTHYEALAGVLARMFPGEHIVAQGEVVARKLAAYLDRHDEHARLLRKDARHRIQFSHARTSPQVAFFAANSTLGGK